MGPTDALSKGKRSIREQYAEQLVDLELPDGAEDLLGAFFVCAREGLGENYFDAAANMLYLGQRGNADEETSPGRAAFNVLADRLAELIKAVNDAEYQEFSPDGDGARYRDVVDLAEKARAIGPAIIVWEETLGLQP
jgi:hypothetical protein